MNVNQIETQRREVDAEATALDQAISAAITSKSYGQLADLEGRADRLAERRAELSHEALRVKATTAHPLFGGAAADEGQGVVLDTKAMKSGRYVSPLAFPEAAMKSLHTAVVNRQSVEVKAFSTVDGLLPAQLDPSIVGTIHENRLLDRLPATPITAPSFEYARATGSTGSPGIVAEGGLKPDVTLNTVSVIVSAVKLAATFGISHETLQDWSDFQSYAQTEMLRQITDLENSELLNGNGTSPNILGLNLTSGALTHAVTTETGIDAVEMAIAQLRVGSSLAEANLLVLHPSTWSALRRTKDSQNRYLVTPDPTQGAGNQLWGVPVLVTTTQAAGAGLLLDTTKFGSVLIREGITVKTGLTNDDFSRNITRFVIEERIALAVKRPTALLTITNLPTA